MLLVFLSVYCQDWSEFTKRDTKGELYPRNFVNYHCFKNDNQHLSFKKLKWKFKRSKKNNIHWSTWTKNGKSGRQTAQAQKISIFLIKRGEIGQSEALICFASCNAGDKGVIERAANSCNFFRNIVGNQQQLSCHATIFLCFRLQCLLRNKLNT